VRPEAWVVQSNGDGGRGLDVTIAVVEELGSESFLYCTDPAATNGPGGVGPQVVARTEGLSSSSPGDQVSLVPVPGRLHLFDSATGARLPS
jgi:multiple sugar transport system ATP-binding protein